MRTITTAVSALVIAGMGTGGAAAATSAQDATTASVSTSISTAAHGQADDSTPINFAPGTDSATVDGSLADNTRTYTFRASAGQEATVDFATPKTSSSQQFGLLGPDGAELDQVSAGVYPLPEDGEYTLQTFNDTQTPFELNLTIPGVPAEDTDSRIEFAPGADSASVEGGLFERPRTYVFGASAGQQATIEPARGAGDDTTGWALIAPDGTEVGEPGDGEFTLNQSGDYTLRTYSEATHPYELSLTIAGAPAQDTALPLRFAPGTDSATVDGSLANQTRTYVFEASAGQEATVDFATPKTSSSQQYGLLAPDGTELPQISAGVYPLPESGEYTLQTFNDTQSPFQLTLTIPAG